MFFVLSKILYFLCLPLTWIVIFILFSIFANEPRWKTRSRKTAIVMLLFFTNPLIANLVMINWEMKPLKYEQLNKNYDYVVVLSGITDPFQEPKDRVHFNKGADRIVHAIELYKKGYAEKMIITGGSGSLTDQTLKEGELLMKFAIESGVPAEDIILENKARNTAENAAYTLKLVDSNSKLLVVTSAFHAKRALLCFKNLGKEVDFFPTDLYSNPLSWMPEDWLIPNINALQFWNIILKEVVGITAYKWKGYI